MPGKDTVITFRGIPERHRAIPDTIVMTALAFVAQPQHFTAYKEWAITMGEWDDTPDGRRIRTILQCMTPGQLSFLFASIGDEE